MVRHARWRRWWLYLGGWPRSADDATGSVYAAASTQQLQYSTTASASTRQCDGATDTQVTVTQPHSAVQCSAVYSAVCAANGYYRLPGEAPTAKKGGENGVIQLRWGSNAGGIRAGGGGIVSNMKVVGQARGVYL